MKIIDFRILEKTSKKGNTYQGLYAITEDKQEIFVCYVNLKK